MKHEPRTRSYGYLLMSREIKFRAWNIVGKCMVNDKTINKELGYAYPLNHPDKYALMQYTGLKDKNDVEIYEGDIVAGVCSTNKDFVCQGLQLENKMGKPLCGTIQYSNTYCQYYFTTDGITYLDLLLGLREIEVIGNIYEDPELLI